MKKVLLIVVLAFLSNVCFGQITLFNSFNCSAITFGAYNTNSFAIAPDLNSVEIYNENCIWEKRVSGLPTFSYIVYLSKNVFTLSGKYEFILATYNSVTSRNEFKLYNEDGQLLFDFEGYYPASIKNNKLITYSITTGMSPYVKIYNIAGSIGLNAAENVDNKFCAYPNPASSMINIKYSVSDMQEMVIRDISGKIIENVLLDPAQGEIGINVSGYSKGVYLYSYGGLSGKFIVQ